METDKQFIGDILTLRNYWLRQSNDPKEVVDGFIHSLLVMFDGDSGFNDFHPIQLTDTTTKEPINDQRPLHEVFHMENNKNQRSY